MNILQLHYSQLYHFVILCSFIPVCVPSESFRFNSSGSNSQAWLSVRVRRRGHIKTMKTKPKSDALYYKWGVFFPPFWDTYRQKPVNICKTVFIVQMWLWPKSDLNCIMLLKLICLLQHIINMYHIIYLLCEQGMVLHLQYKQSIITVRMPFCSFWVQ